MSFVKTLIPLTKNGRISLISMEQSPESYIRVRQRVGKEGETYTEFTVIQPFYTLATLGLPGFSDIFEKGANLVGVFEII